MIRRTIREWERIGYGSVDDAIPEPIADRLAAVASTSVFSGRGGEGVLEHGRNSLRARGVVGVIATPDAQLEILPKIEGVGEMGVDDQTLRRRLVHMLSVAHDLRIDVGAMTALAWQRDTVLEILIRLFCGRLAEAVRQGMPRQYIAQDDDLPALRGGLAAPDSIEEVQDIHARLDPQIPEGLRSSGTIPAAASVRTFRWMH